MTVAETTYAEATDLELAATTAVVTASTVLGIGSRAATAASERAEAQLPQPGSAATVAELRRGVPSAGPPHG